MSEPEKPLARWSRLKREAKRENAAEPAGQSGQAHSAGKGPGSAATPAETASEAPVFDPATLPPIESITAGTDIKAFLQAGVPAALTRAALRRVWTTDPAIRDFIGIAENQWDFTDPTAIPGFGTLQPHDVGRLVSQVMGRVGELPNPESESPAEEARTSAAGLQCETPGPPDAQPAPGIQAPGIPEGNRVDTQVTERLGEVNRRDIAVQDGDLPAEGGSGPNRRPHGRALPQ